MIWWRRRPAEPPATPAEALDEQLSAYIDGDLPAAEASAIETRLAAEPAVRDALTGMQQIRETLGALGETTAPRAFTLAVPPARAGLPRLELFARLGAAVSALALAAVLVGDALTTAGPAGQAALSPQTATLQAAAPLPEAQAQAAAAGDGAAEAESASEEAESPSEEVESASAEAEAAATPEVTTLTVPAVAPATADADSADDDDRATATAPSPAQPDGRQPAPTPATDEAAPTLEQARAADPTQPAAADPAGDTLDTALDAARVALLVLVALFGAAALWQFARRPR